MKNYRCIYMIEAITTNGDLTYRYFAANKRTANSIAHKHGQNAVIRRLRKDEHQYINPADVIC